MLTREDDPYLKQWGTINPTVSKLLSDGCRNGINAVTKYLVRGIIGRGIAEVSDEQCRFRLSVHAYPSSMIKFPAGYDLSKGLIGSLNLPSRIMGIQTGDDDQGDGAKSLNPYWGFAKLGTTLFCAVMVVACFVAGGIISWITWWHRTLLFGGSASFLSLCLTLIHNALECNCSFG
ncbi:MAG: hypothetical protein H0U76_26325 [Ktedonobacteraceae bacterium]|nr:hypothetical protein [Ktedonobacteraceae bacterium]